MVNGSLVGRYPGGYPPAAHGGPRLLRLGEAHGRPFTRKCSRSEPVKVSHEYPRRLGVGPPLMAGPGDRRRLHSPRSPSSSPLL